MMGQLLPVSLGVFILSSCLLFPGEYLELGCLWVHCVYTRAAYDLSEMENLSCLFGPMAAGGCPHTLLQSSTHLPLPKIPKGAFCHASSLSSDAPHCVHFCLTVVGS
ncbi:hypothetical protein AMECASPLE_019411 [Ameca splendens]|uniref:Secreted protein n=1 Tax=Ameca splendens TaxID=208324 RepID=A0ABV0XG30_9TELE